MNRKTLTKGYPVFFTSFNIVITGAAGWTFIFVLMCRYTTTLLALLVLMSAPVLAQKKDKIPKKIRTSPELLSNHLTKNCSTDRAKLDSIYAWIISNIDYDYDVVTSSNPLHGQTSEQVLKKKETICFGYVELLVEMLGYQGIEATRIEGYTRDFDPDYDYTLINSDHAWVAINLNGKWKLADPTWDAGYIGRIPRKEKTYPKRWTKERTFKKEKKRVKWEKKIERKMKAFDEREKAKDPYTDKIGFVRDTSYDYYLVHPDTFLLTHLPEIPEWQLREHTLNMDQFCQPKDSVRMALSDPKGDVLDYNSKISQYMGKSIIEQWQHNADAGLEFNPENHSVVAINYYNTVGVFLDTDLKKRIKKLSNLAERPIWEELIAKADTAIVHAKLAQKQVKDLNKQERNFYKASFKAEATAQKAMNKHSEKLLKEVEDLEEDIQDANEKLDEYAQYTGERLAKYQMLRDRFKEKGEPNDPNISEEMQAILDEFNAKCATADSTMDAFDQLLSTSSLQGVMNHIVEAEYENRVANAYVSAFSIAVADNIAEHDSIAVQELELARMVLEDSVQNELFPKEVMNSVKDLERYIKSQKKELKTLAEEGKARYLRDYDRMFWAKYHKRLERCKDIMLRARSRHIFLMNNLPIIEEGLDYVETSAKSLDESREKRDEHLYDNLEKAAERGKKLYSTIQSDAKAWKSEMKRRLKE
ncbi:MAG: hypothetical protein NXI10_01620 [bacterium]|nr:hypothetical protein [bacterium]